MLTAEQLRELVSYSPETGVFLWRAKASNNTVIGKEAGRLRANGYREIGVGGKLILAHRLAWLYMHGEFPAAAIDHVNGVRDDNRIVNLRSVSAGENLQNQAYPRGVNPYLGVSFQQSRKKWRADICVNGRQKLIGRFETAEEAKSAYIKAKSQMHIPGRLIWPELVNDDHPIPSVAVDAKNKPISESRETA